MKGAKADVGATCYGGLPDLSRRVLCAVQCFAHFYVKTPMQSQSLPSAVSTA